MNNQLLKEFDLRDEGYGDSRQLMRYDKFKDMEELINFMNTQCEGIRGEGEEINEPCCRKPECIHYSHLTLSLKTKMLIKHWSPDIFKRDSQEIPYCSKRNQPVENKENS